MIGLDPDDLAEALEAIARAEGRALNLQRAALARIIAEAIAHAEAEADGHWEDETAAVFYAFGRRSASFRPMARPFVEAVVQAQAVANGFELEMNEVEFEVLYARLTLGKIELLELRGWVALRLRPLGQASNRPPPRRPR